MNQSQVISMYQPMLYRIAYKIVGSVADAEDIVQDTLLKWLTIDTEKINNSKAYLIKSVTNNCLNHLNSLKRKKDEYLESLHAQEIIDKYKELELFNFDLENEVSSALNIIHKKLEPLEKGIYVLREFFDVEYDELQEIFNKKKENCRQLFSRAKSKLDKETAKIKSDWSSIHFMDSFKEACKTNNPKNLIDHIQEEIKK